ncbi:unnamed protein product [Ixodes pacificus]
MNVSEHKVYQTLLDMGHCRKRPLCVPQRTQHHRCLCQMGLWHYDSCGHTNIESKPWNNAKELPGRMKQYLLHSPMAV